MLRTGTHSLTRNKAGGWRSCRSRTLHHINVENLALAIEPTGRAHDVTWGAASAFGAGLEQRFAPAIGTPAHALLHFRCSAFGHCHGEMGRSGLLVGFFQRIERSPSAVTLLGGRDIYIIPCRVVHR